MMKSKYLLLVISVSTLLISSAAAQHIGINTEDPQAALDINGDVVFRPVNLIVPDSMTTGLDVNTAKYSCYRIAGADSAFAISGILAGMDGRTITLINESGFPMSLHHDDSAAVEINRIITGNHDDLVLDDMGMVTMQYDTSAQRWLVNSSSHIPAGANVWDTTGTNIFFENYVGIGTESPMTPLAIETEVDEIGFSHMAGADSITVASSVSELAGSVGTTSDHVFSLQAGGEGRMHIWPEGDVVIGNDSIVGSLLGLQQSRMNPFNSKLTVFTPLGETGYSHIAGDNALIVDESIGISSASIGTKTEHSFRLKTNDIGRLHVWYDGRVVIGTNEQGPVSQFSVFTGNSSYGLAHIGGSGQIVASHIGLTSASIGTFTDHNFRLVTNGQPRLNIRYDGAIGIGTIDPVEMLTVQTANSNFGISHRSNGGIVLATHVGEVSASFGTHSNHNFRLVTNGTSRIHVGYDGKVGIGTTNPIHLFEVKGTMRSQEVIVETQNWPDYVFAEDYNLTSLTAVENFIRENNHLPNIPSANEIETNGLQVGEMQRKMMEKIEELTLHIIDLNKRIATLESKQP